MSDPTHTPDHDHTHWHEHGHGHAHPHGRGHDHSHAHPHGHAHDHSHAPAHGHGHGHGHAPGAGHSHSGDGPDYAEAVAAYRRTFASRDDVLRETPDPAVKAMLQRFREIGCETCFDRFDAQKPHCAFGLAGVCCKNCNMGPCKITRKSPRGVCGADADLIAARNLLRWVAAGVAAHGARGREVMLALKAAGEGRLDLPVLGEEKVRKTAAALGIDAAGRSVKALAGLVADALLEDLSRTVPAPHRTLQALATPERLRVWRELDILPIGASHEVFEALHRTTTGTDGDWENVMRQLLRCGLAFAWSSVAGSAIAMDCLYGLPQRGTLKSNLGALKTGTVNIAVHGHSPVLVGEILRLGRSPEFAERARAAGAAGIEFYGICCSGLSGMYRTHGVIPLSNAVGAELVMGTGALDLWVADVQDVFPSIMEVARCFRTAVVTTSDSARLPGAEHFGLDHDHGNLHAIGDLARRILLRAIESYAGRRDVPVFIPPDAAEAQIGFSLENVSAQLGGLAPLVEALRDGRILGIVNLVGCNNPRLVYEKAIVTVADHLLQEGVLVFTNGCASFPLLKLGYCHPSAAARCGAGLAAWLEPWTLPPVWHMGECLDNARASGFFRGIADATGQPFRVLPLAFVSPEWSNEKGLGSALGFRLLGLNSYHCVYPPVQGAPAVSRFLYESTAAPLGSVMVVDPDPAGLARRIVADLKERRRALGWA
ncbi:MAG: carbon monoxide dehydrogenase [Lentisphaerae bacterium]|nr:carbon monoxide dehydrogenase [Lentisphaerota bacterium]